MPKKEDLQNIKAGVEGGLEDVPSPMDSEAPSPSEAQEEYGEAPQTIIGGGSSFQQREEEPTFSLDMARQQMNPLPSMNLDMDRVQELAETIVNERWEDLMGKMGNLPVWRERTSVDLAAVKQELLRLESRFEQLQGAVLGRVKEYDEGVRSLHTEMKALEKVFQQILEPLVSNIKELDRITKELKRK